jgi:hypothetical protein
LAHSRNLGSIADVMAFGSVDPGGAASRALRSAGLRVTMPRLAMLAWLEAHLKAAPAG